METGHNPGDTLDMFPLAVSKSSKFKRQYTPESTKDWWAPKINQNLSPAH